jgi:aspartokinase/homoserine dehydrogenase 1
VTRSYILKFGGSSVATPANIQHIISLTTDRETYQAGSVRAIIFSAFQGITDTLIDLANQATDPTADYRADFTNAIEQRHIEAVHELIAPEKRGRVLAEVGSLLNSLDDMLRGITLLRECSPRTLEQVTSYGERLSSCIIARAYEDRGISVSLLDGASLITTTGACGQSIPDKSASYECIREAFNSMSDMAIVPGFIARDESGSIVTLGRGGSDLTAALIGAALEVDLIEIWTDVDGILTADPRKVSQAFAINEVTFEEAMELSHFGAKVLYPPTIQPAIESGIPISIKNTFNPAALGTTIRTKTNVSSQPITGISSIDSVALVQLQGSGMVGVAGIASRFFKTLSEAGINVILITQASSEHTICCGIAPNQVLQACSAVEQEFDLEIQAGRIDPLHVQRDLSIISIVGETMRQTPGMAGRIFRALGDNGINVAAIAQGSSERSISAVVATHDESKALNAIHDEFFLSKTKSVHLWLAGTGLIGKTLLSQLKRQHPILLRDYGIDVKLLGVANSRKMRHGHTEADTLSMDDPLAVDGTPSNLHSFVSACIASNLPNSIFVDCSAHDAPTEHYTELLSNSVAIVTPNKRAFSREHSFYELLNHLGTTRRTPLLYETCVGAALPILSTLQDLIKSGDTILRIEAILSGSLSFICNTMRQNGTPFSEAVMEAKNRGFTEPDPRDDLSGMDVARKVLILARNAGIPLELPDIHLESLLPQSTQECSLETFINELPSFDKTFSARVADASANDQGLFFSATIDCTSCAASIGLESFPKDHPFCALSGADNMIAFTTARYREQPLVVQGPGAGAEVTAAGVFADIMRAIR